MSVPGLSNKFAKRLVHDLGQAYFALGSDLKLIDHNKNFARLIGHPDADVRGQTLAEVLLFGAHSLTMENVRRALQTHQRAVFVDFCSTINCWLEFRISAVRDQVLGIVEDVTHRHVIQTQAESDGQKAAKTIASAGMGVARLKLDGTWEFANERCQLITGYDQAELTKLTFDDVCCFDYKGQDTAKYVSLIRNEQPYFTSEVCLVNKHGERIWIHLNVSLIRSANGQPLSFALILYDIGERKASDESLKFALEAAQMGEWDYDATSDETRRSIRFNEIYGVESTKQSWSFRDFLNYTHLEDRTILAEAFRRAITGGEELNIEVRQSRSDSDPCWISLRGKAYLNQQGRVVRMAGLITDITRNKNAAIDLQNAKLAAEDANREKSYFLANMSHEIRTPLGAILGFAEVLRDRKIRPAIRDKYLDIVTRNGQSLAALIDDILDLSKVESGHLDIVSENGNVYDVIQEVLNLLRIKADAKKLDFTLSWSPEVPHVIQIDMIRLRQILINVIGNAIKFTTCGAVAINIERGVNSPCLNIRVQDTGPGMTDEQSTRLFQPFMQADSSTSRKFGGTGLGLALSRRLSRAMGGDLVLESSTLGLGSTFLISVPLKLPNPSLIETTHTTAVFTNFRQVSGLRVLLAEDSPDNQELIKLMLDKMGVLTIFADDGSIAVSKALNENFDLVLMDMQMPGLDGYAATRTLREAGFDRPIIALTANAMRHDRARCLEAGCTDYLSKPIDSSHLYRLIGINAALNSH